MLSTTEPSYSDPKNLPDDAPKTFEDWKKLYNIMPVPGHKFI